MTTSAAHKAWATRRARALAREIVDDAPLGEESAEVAFLPTDDDLILFALETAAIRHGAAAHDAGDDLRRRVAHNHMAQQFSGLRKRLAARAAA